MPGYAPPLKEFLARRVICVAGARLDWEDVYQAFAGPGTGWRSPPSRKAFVEAMAYLCTVKGVHIAMDGSRVYCLDCALQQDGAPEAEDVAPAAPRCEGHKISIADWCVKFGFEWAARFVPEEWLRERPKRARLEALERYRR